MDLDKLVSFDGRIGRGPFWTTSLIAFVIYVIGFMFFNMDVPLRDISGVS